MLKYIVFKISKRKNKAGKKLNELVKDGYEVTRTYGKNNRWIIMEKEMIEEEPKIEELKIEEPKTEELETEEPKIEEHPIVIK